MMLSVETTVETVIARLEAVPGFSGKGRFLCAIAGPPGAGKSMLAEALVEALIRARGAQAVALLPMDGFHLDNRILEASGLLAQKGAPETFDAAGFALALRRLRSGDEDVVHPVFDRDRDIAIAGAGLIRRKTRIVVIEGNYLLLDRPPWCALRPVFDFSMFLRPSDQELERRLTQRWRDQGFAPDRAAARARENDMPNARRVVSESAEADLTLSVDDAP